jgi:hypothetical protein
MDGGFEFVVGVEARKSHIGVPVIHSEWAGEVTMFGLEISYDVSVPMIQLKNDIQSLNIVPFFTCR